MDIVVIIILTVIALAFGVLIYLAYQFIPSKVKGIEKTEEVASLLPGINCGACGAAGCFGYAQVLANNPGELAEGKCTVSLQDPARIKSLEEALGVNFDASSLRKRAIVRCRGKSPVIYNYSGIQTCKGITKLLKGNKQCPFACVGLGDCAAVCPQKAITVDPETNVAHVDWEKCTGCGLCVAQCPQGLIQLVPAETQVAFLCDYGPIRDIPGREKCEIGCIHCRKCLRACEQGAITWNKERGIPEFDLSKCTGCLKCVQACEHLVLLATAKGPAVKEKAEARAK